MTLRRRSLIALAPIALLAAACAPTADSATGLGTNTDGKGSVVLNVGDQKGGQEAVLRAAGELESLDYRIKWSTFTSGPPLLEALNSGAVDIGSVGNTPPVFAAGGGQKLRVISATRGSAAGDAVLLPKDSKIRGVRDLKGRKIAVAQGSSAHYQLYAQLKKAGLGFDDVQLSLLQPADALAAFTSGKVDAWAVWDPYTSQVLVSGKARVLADGDGITNGLGFGVANPTALEDKAKAKAIGDFVERLRRAQDWVHDHPEAWAKVWAKETGLPYEAALAAVRRTSGTDVPVRIDKPAIASEQDIADAFVDLGLIPRRFDFADYVDHRFDGDLPPSTTAPRTYRKD